MPDREYRTAVYELFQEGGQNHSNEQATIDDQEWPGIFENKSIYLVKWNLKSEKYNYWNKNSGKGLNSYWT